MKKITSAALLALKLTWLAALAFTLTGAAVQIFYVFRELMPGGVPLQTTFGFEQLLQSAAERVGKFWMVLLLYMLGMDIGKSVKTVYTMNRLGLSENQMTLVFGLVFSGYFLLYWAFQIALCYASSSGIPVSPWWAPTPGCSPAGAVSGSTPCSPWANGGGICAMSSSV
jgi:hypothetical protein